MREMKDSGIEWIGEIPADWKVIKNKYLLSLLYSGGTPSVSNNDFYCFEGGTPFVSISDMSTVDYVLSTQKRLTGSGLKDKNLKILPIGTILYSIYATVGAVSELKIEAAISQAMLALQVNSKVNKSFYKYNLAAMKDYIFSNANGNTQFNLNAEKVKNFYFVLPNVATQRRIANYLDHKCSQIDAIIARQQEVIEKLKAYKLSVITEAVTKGLNPDVPMKDSGVEWIGEIPEHWKMVRLKFLLSHIIDCPHETPIYSADGDYLVIRTADQDLGKLRTDEDMYRLDEGEYQNRIRRMPLEKDDIVYGREGERWGLACLVPESNKYCLGQRMLQFRCKRELFLPRFAMWALNSKFVYLQGAVDTIGSTSPHVNISTVRNFLIPVLPISEQQEIAEYIDKKMSQLDKEIEHRENLICKLNEYKKSLIYEVVTGKQEV